MDTPTSEEGSHASPITDVVGDETQAHQNSLCCNGLSPPNISVLDKLIKTCPVWLQLCMDQQSAAQVLEEEPVGVFLVRKDAELKMLVLSVHTSTSDISEYRIKEEKSMLYLEGSALVFEDIFKLVGFYCVSRDVLPFTLRLPHSILEAKSHPELDAISNLGTDFWNSSLNIKAVRTVLSQKGANTSNTQLNSTKSSLHFSRGVNQSSCEIELSVGNERLWFVKPIFIEECVNVLPHDKPPLESKTANAQVSPARTSYRRPPPPPPPISGALKTVNTCSPGPEMSSRVGQPHFGKLDKDMEADHDDLRKGPGRMERCMSETTPKKSVYPVIPPRRRSTGKYSDDPLVDVGKMEANRAQDKKENKVLGLQSTPDSNNSEVSENILVDVSVKTSEDSRDTTEECEVGQNGGEHRSCTKSKPLPPPRKRRLSHQLTSISLTPTVEESIDEDITELANLSLGDSERKCNIVIQTYNGDPALDGSSSSESNKSSTYLINPALNTSGGELDSLSTSSTEDDLERVNSRPIKKTHSIMLDRAKNRLSLVNLSSVFSAFLSADRKLQKKMIELAKDKESYFGHLVQDYKAYSLEMMAKHSSSTEMLQEIRLMMTQLKNYLLQSAELQTIIDPAVHKEDKLEVIAEAALCKCVLKPLKGTIDSHLCLIHTDSGALRLMKENQQVIQGTTTTELGVTTSVPETIVIDKILNKFTAMHKAYSPEKKITFLLKACKLIYDSMSTGTPGKSYGADDFLPVLMYVLARCSLTELLLDVEYMMELMDPALQLGEGSYYLTTTYGALAHIKNYDKVTVTRQLSMEVQDSIHRWEKRRTLSKTLGVSRTSVQDFITIAFQEPDSQTRTLAIKPDTCAELLAHQCALKFEVAEPHRYGLFILVDERCLLLASDAYPHKIKSYLLKSETKKYFNFVYKEIGIDEAATAQIIKEPNFLE